MKKFSFFFLLFFLFLQSSYASENEITIYKNSGEKVWGNKITQMFLQKLSLPIFSSLLNVVIESEDLEELGCLNFNSLTEEQKRIFYVVFFAAIAERESDFKADDETFDRGHFNMNIGLFQIDKNSAVRHAFNIVGNKISRDELKNPIVNFMIGLSILKNQLEGVFRDDTTGRLFPKKHFYWEVLGHRKREKFLKSFNNNRSNLPFCQT